MDKKNALYQKKFKAKLKAEMKKQERTQISGAYANPANHKKWRDKINQEEGK